MSVTKIGEKSYKDPRILRQKYKYEGLTQVEVADELGCGRTTVRRYLKRHNIQRQWEDPRALYHLYHRKGMSSREIADLLDCGKTSILRELRRNDIDRRKSNREKHPYYGMDTDGYMVFRHYSGGVENTVYEHRLLAISEYGFDDVKNMVVHHDNELKWDNRPENIELMTIEDHAKHHAKSR